MSSAIIDDTITASNPTGNNSTPFYFLFSLSLASFIGLALFVDLKKSRVEQARFLKEEEMARRVKEEHASYES